MTTVLRSATRHLQASTQASTSTQRFYSAASKTRTSRRAHRSPPSPTSPSVTTTAPLPRVSHPSPPPVVPHVSAVEGKTEIDKGKSVSGGVVGRPEDLLVKRGWEEPPLVASARAKSTKQRSIWESYLVLDPKTRLYFSLGLGAFALIGLYVGDWLVPQGEAEMAYKDGEQVPVMLPGAGDVGVGGRV